MGRAVEAEAEASSEASGEASGEGTAGAGAGSRWKKLLLRMVFTAAAVPLVAGALLYAVDTVPLRELRLAVLGNGGAGAPQAPPQWQQPQQQPQQPQQPPPRQPEPEQGEQVKVPPKVHRAVKVGGSVEERSWEEGDDFLRDIVMRRRPVLIRGAPEAPQLQWQWQQLVEALPLLEDVRLRDAGAGGVFTLRGERDRGGMLEDPSPDATASVPAVATRRFLETAADPSLFLYWTKDAEVLDGSPLALRAADGGAASNATEAAWRRWAVKEVQLERDDFGGAAIDELIMPMLWLSQPGVVAQAHYDKSHNFVTQVLGNKRWLIFPPFQHFRLYQYPHLHPSYKQSQVDFAAPDLKRFPSFRGAQALEAEVGPGDVLYMPPYWFHRVETTEMSLSLSVVSPSEEELVLSEAYWKDMPLGSLEGKTERTLGARRYLLEVLARLRGVKSPRWFADRLYEQRYAALFPEASLLMQEKLAAFDCHLAETDPLTGARLESTVRNSLPREELEATADFVAECANDDVIPPAVREQWAQSYVEEIARWARGDPEEAVLFIRKCLSDDEHVKVPEQVEWVEGPEVIKIGENAMEGDWIEPAERRRLERRKRARERAKAGKQKPGQQKPKKKHAEL